MRRRAPRIDGANAGQKSAVNQMPT